MKEKDNDKEKYFQERSKIYADVAEALQKKHAEDLESCRKEPSTAAPKLFALANSTLDLCSNYLIIAGIYTAIFNGKDNNSLEEARKSLFKALILLENIVSGKIDTDYDDYGKYEQEMSQIDIHERYRLVRKIGLTEALIKTAFGTDSKWKWYFIDIEGRLAVVAKNLFNPKKYYTSFTDASSADYSVTCAYINTIEKLLSTAADGFHERFSLSTNAPQDLYFGISFLAALRRVMIFTGNSEEAEGIKRKRDSWTRGFEQVLAAHIKKNKENKEN